MGNINEILNIDSEKEGVTFKKGTVLQNEGDLNPVSYYVRKGLLRSYTIDKKGKEHVFMFAPEGWLIGDVESQEFNKPSELYIECIEDAEVVIINRDSFNLSALNEKQLQDHIRLLFRRTAVLQRRMLMMLSATATERYTEFLTIYPELPNRLPQKLIASYLGITPEALSKIRGELVKTRSSK